MEDKVELGDYSKILALQEYINSRLRDTYESNKDKGRENLSKFLVDFVEALVDELNANGHSFGRCDYSGDVNFENSEQQYSDGEEMGCGVLLHFHGFAVKASWEGRDKYA
ncbi:hypothetical protein O5O45_00340 [Hahella aquimaris]|uniref:hypothetical protein n=1 Tax=Hahella sp. HNIBRBA332 TaxID=3015983 RepID=UPI00273ABA73|nr:hypothetical protein [Hahella sp. HNIBRBA332]WLQ14382.1 hypothetical protein O5O45_00340 [Hahella sp. HNIBRBA332]